MYCRYWNIFNVMVFCLRSNKYEIYSRLEKRNSYCSVWIFVNLIIENVSFIIFCFSVASIFLGYGGLFLLLWVGIFIWNTYERMTDSNLNWCSLLFSVYYISRFICCCCCYCFRACWWSFFNTKKKSYYLF